MRIRKMEGFGEATPNPSYDYIFGKGRTEFWENVPAAVGQSVLSRLMLWQGEWFLDNTEGTPWLQEILSAGIKNTTPLYDQAIKFRVLQTPHVTDVLDYSSNLNVTTRKLTVSMKLDTEYGGLQLPTIVFGTPAVGFVPALVFTDPRDSQYLPTL
jgi:hypothetical protein